MKKVFLFLVLFFACLQDTNAQSLDTADYTYFVQADTMKFVAYAQAAGFTVERDGLSETLFARKKGFLYSKPWGTKNNNQYYDLQLIVSTLQKDNNRFILRNAKELEDKKGTWMDNGYLYIEWDQENRFSGETWYRVLVYRKK